MQNENWSFGNMVRALDEVQWGEPALSLLSRCRELIDNTPAVMVIRHSEAEERLGPRRLLTDEGKRAAYDFGSRLPANRSYRIFHNVYQRTQETAEQILQGIQSQGLKAALGGPSAFLAYFQTDPNKVWHYLKRDSVIPFFMNWIGGRYPPWEIEPGYALAQQAAYGISKNLQNSDKNGFDIYVAHDLNVRLYMFHWLGELSTLGSTEKRNDSPYLRLAGYLDGFIIQLHEDTISAYWGKTMKEVLYPYWWRF